MLSERITELFGLLQCTNSDIARFAGCTPSNISRLKSGSREPDPDSRTMLRLVRGIYRYADYENMLDLLCSLCGTADPRAENLVPAVITWLYSDKDYELPEPVMPKTKQEQISRMQCFSERLDKVMTLLDYSNSRLAADLNVDISLISRYRSGIYHPNRNVDIRNRLADLILVRAERTGRMEDLAALCDVEPAELVRETISDWLYGPDENRRSEIAETIFHSIDSFKPGQGIPSNIPDLPAVQEAERYWGTEGLRNAVVRFLTDTAREGGELLLYSDEPMDWMSSDPDFFALWASLMAACLEEDVRIRIIHNIDRGGSEMISAIRGWFPLYISGKIEPYISGKESRSRFYHTVFLRSGKAGILGFFPAGMGDSRWYDYITDKGQMEALYSGFRNMFENASPFLKTYPASLADAFWSRYHAHSGKADAILKGLSVATMPEGLLDKMLTRAEICGQTKEAALNFYQSSRDNLQQILVNGELHELICLPAKEDVAAGRVNVNFEAETNGLCLTYTPEEYAAHLAVMKDLVRNEKNYHLTLLPNAPFQDLQVFTMKNAAAVVRCREPYTAFVFYNPLLLQSVDYYCDMLANQYASDRTTVIQILDNLL